MKGKLVLIAAAMLANPPAFGGGFEVPSQGSRATGQGDAFVAQADDASAIHYNPAGLTQIQGSELTLGLYTVLPGFEFQGDGPIGDAHSNDPIYIPHLYSVTDAGTDRWRFGLGVNNVFGIREDWGDSSPLRFSVTHADLTVLNVAPMLAYRVSEHLSIGGGPNFYFGDVELNNQVPLPQQPPGAFQFEGNGTGIGASAGLLWTINPRHAVGLLYRSPMQIEFEGSAKIDRGALPPIGRSDADTNIDFPQSAVIGYAFRPTPRLKLEADVQWMNWETFDSVSLQSDNPLLSAFPPMRFEYRDAFTYRFGAEYQLDEQWRVRAGYFYLESASPDQTFNPVVTDLDSHVFTAGLGYSRPRWAVDLAYHLVFAPDRQIDNSVNSPPGDYSNLTHTIMVSVTWRM